MTIENVMYLVLGALAAGLLALLVLPAVWRRAVRLTRKRIEAATPMTMAEFRADKDRLRAEFALETRRLELTIENLRARLSDEIEASGRGGDPAKLRHDQDQRAALLAEMQERETALNDRIHELERQFADVSQRLRMQERDLERRLGQIAELRAALGQNLPGATGLEPVDFDEADESGFEALATAFAIERKRAGFLEAEARKLIAFLDAAPHRPADLVAATAALREALTARPAPAGSPDTDDLAVAEARIAHAESRLTTLLEQSREEAGEAPVPGQMLADKLSIEDQLDLVRSEVLGLEKAVSADWGTERAQPEALRDRLRVIAREAEKLIDQMTHSGADSTESLFERVQRYSHEPPAGVDHGAPVPGAADGAAGAPGPVRQGSGPAPQLQMAEDRS